MDTSSIFPKRTDSFKTFNLFHPSAHSADTLVREFAGRVSHRDNGN